MLGFKKFVLVFFVHFFLLAVDVLANTPNILIIKSYDLPPYNSAEQGFISSIDINYESILIDSNLIEDKIKFRSPSAILAIGNAAADKLEKVDHIPVLYIMAPLLKERTVFKSNTYVLEMKAKDEVALKALKDTIPEGKNIGVLLNEGIAAGSNIMSLAAGNGLRLQTKSINGAHEIIPGLTNLLNSGQLDILWIYPSTPFLDPSIIEMMLLFSFDNKIPVVGFSRVFLNKGGVLSIGIDEYDIGVQASGLIKSIIAGKAAKNNFARKALVLTNHMIAEKLEIELKTSKKELIYLAKDFLAGAM